MIVRELRDSFINEAREFERSTRRLELIPVWKVKIKSSIEVLGSIWEIIILRNIDHFQGGCLLERSARIVNSHGGSYFKHC